MRKRSRAMKMTFWIIPNRKHSWWWHLQSCVGLYLAFLSGFQKCEKPASRYMWFMWQRSGWYSAGYWYFWWRRWRSCSYGNLAPDHSGTERTSDRAWNSTAGSASGHERDAQQKTCRSRGYSSCSDSPATWKWWRALLWRIRSLMLKKIHISPLKAKSQPFSLHSNS